MMQQSDVRELPTGNTGWYFTVRWPTVRQAPHRIMKKWNNLG